MNIKVPFSLLLKSYFKGSKGIKVTSSWFSEFMSLCPLLILKKCFREEFIQENILYKNFGPQEPVQCRQTIKYWSIRLLPEVFIDAFFTKWTLQ